jgi:hypothetical protein
LMDSGLEGAVVRCLKASAQQAGEQLRAALATD